MQEEMKERIKGLRNKKGITQGKLGEVLGVSQNAISLIEKGTNKPTVQQIEILSRFFEVSADYLLFGEENIEPIEREILKTIRDDKTLYGKLIKMMEAKKIVFEDFENFEGLVA